MLKAVKMLASYGVKFKVGALQESDGPYYAGCSLDAKNPQNMDPINIKSVPFLK
jgi:hypothetical protein